MGESIAELKARIAVLEQEKREQYERAERLQTKLDAVLAKFFAPSSEKLSAAQQRDLGLFDEAEVLATPDEAGRQIEVPAHTRRKTRRPRHLDPALPRREVELDLPEADKHCACGSQLTRIGEEVTEKLDIEPPKITVIRYRRPKYACHACEGAGDEEQPAVRIAPPAASLIPGGVATDATVAYVVTAKFCDALPLYRQEGQFARLGADISRQTLADWILAAAEAAKPVYEALARFVRSGPALLADETTVQVHRENNRANSSPSWMWCAYGGEPERPGVFFHYAPSRSAETAETVIGAYSGLFQADGYRAYATLTDRRTDLRRAGCFAHARRYFHEAATGTAKSAGAREGLAYIAKLYRIEKELASRERDEEFAAERRTRAEPVLVQFKTWLDKKAATVPPSSVLGKAVNYAYEQWPFLVRYLESPYLTPDTNRVENAIRPFVIGRRNWLFAGSPRGAHASATLYSLIQTCRVNNVEPYRYLRTLFHRLSHAAGELDHDALLPQFIELND
ncbi:MAG: IS66 family transposase [Spirochaetes bacterium]|nr:IS66 family transposase [Spirochaetota bacterium]